MKGTPSYGDSVDGLSISETHTPICRLSPELEQKRTEQHQHRETWCHMESSKEPDESFSIGRQVSPIYLCLSVSPSVLASLHHPQNKALPEKEVLVVVTVAWILPSHQNRCDQIDLDSRCCT